MQLSYSNHARLLSAHDSISSTRLHLGRRMLTGELVTLIGSVCLHWDLDSSSYLRDSWLSCEGCQEFRSHQR